MPSTRLWDVDKRAPEFEVTLRRGDDEAETTEETAL